MMLSVTCKAAIKAVVFIGSRLEHPGKISLAEIAHHIESSEHTVGKMLQQLVRAGMIMSTKGPGGGFYMTREQALSPIIRIVESVDGLGVFDECGMGLAKCSSARPCPIHHEYKKTRDMYENIFKRNRVIDLCKPISKKRAYLT